MSLFLSCQNLALKYECHRQIDGANSKSYSEMTTAEQKIHQSTLPHSYPVGEHADWLKELEEHTAAADGGGGTFLDGETEPDELFVDASSMGGRPAGEEPAPPIVSTQEYKYAHNLNHITPKGTVCNCSSCKVKLHSS